MPNPPIAVLDEEGHLTSGIIELSVRGKVPPELEKKVSEHRNACALCEGKIGYYTRLALEER